MKESTITCYRCRRQGVRSFELAGKDLAGAARYRCVTRNSCHGRVLGLLGWKPAKRGHGWGSAT